MLLRNPIFWGSGHPPPPSGSTPALKIFSEFSLTGECGCFGEDWEIGTCDNDHQNRWCVNCSDSMGAGCEELCVHGTEEVSRSGICNCDSCYNDTNCNVLCDGHGQCGEDDTCVCDEGYKGDYCKELNCPGMVYGRKF